MKRVDALLDRIRHSEIAVGVCRGVLVGSAVVGLAIGWSAWHWPTPAQPSPVVTPSVPKHVPRFADFAGHSASPEVRVVADWVADTNDAAGANFVIIDKRDARVYVFDGSAHLRGSSPVLLGAAAGDDTVPGIGNRPIADVLPEERTTPAGRFVAERGHNAHNEDVVWVDYDAAVSMHRVITTNPRERRLERLATPTPADNRISYGCINIPVAFYENYIRPAFAAERGIVYVLPEQKSLEQVFGLSLPGGVTPLNASTTSNSTIALRR